MSPTDSKRLVIKGGTLIDGTGRARVPNGAIVIEGHEIVRVAGEGMPEDVRPADIVIDATGKFIMPGMIDGHVHLSSHQGALPGVGFTSTPEFATLWSARNVGRVLRAGVTGISVPGGKWYVDVTVREAIDGGLIEGPRVFCAGRALTPYGGIFDASEATSEAEPGDAVGVLCNSREDYIRETRRQCKRGVNLIKIADSYWGDTQTVSGEEIAAVADEDLDAVAEAGIPIMPVFTQCQLITEQGDDMGFGNAMRDRVKAQLETSYRTIEQARKRGIEILAGTDSGNAVAFAHGAYHGREAEIFVTHLGFSPMEAILACTSRNARVIGLEGRVGVIAPGQLADIIMWDADPVADITVLQRPSQLVAVIKDGRVIDRQAEGFRHLEREPARARISAQG